MAEQNPGEADNPPQKSVSSLTNIFDSVSAQKTPLKPTTLAERQEETRGVLAKTLIDILKWVVIFLLVSAIADKIAAAVFALNDKKYEPNSAEFKDIATLTLTSLSGLAGTALGFYFGSRDTASRERKED